MQMTSKNQRKITNTMKNLFLFVLLIGFVTSTSNTTDINPNLNGDIILEKLNSGDLSVLKNENFFSNFKSIIEKEKNEIMEKKSFNDFEKTFIYKIIKIIEFKIIIFYYYNPSISMIEMNEMLKLSIENMNELSELNIYNNTFYNKTIFHITKIYCIIENIDLNFISFDEKIIPIIYKIIENNPSLKEEFFQDMIDFFRFFYVEGIFSGKLANNEKLNEFINIINKYINFLIVENDFKKISTFICYFYNYRNQKFILKNSYCMKVLLKLMDKYFQCLKENIDFYDLQKNIDFYVNHTFETNITKKFLIKYLRNTSYFETKDLDTLSNIFNNIVDIEIYINKGTSFLYLFTIEFYIEYITTISEENKEKNSKLIEIFEKNVNKFITSINSLQIDVKNYDYYIKRYNYISNNGYNYISKIKKCLENFDPECKNFTSYNSELIKNIIITLNIYIEKIVLSELELIDYDITKIHKRYLLKDFLSLGPKELEKFEFKLVKDRALKIIKEFNKTSGLKELSDVKFLEFVFLFELINMDIEENRNLVFKFFDNYSEKISKFDYNAKDCEFFIFLFFPIMNIVEKLHMDDNIRKKYLEKLNKLLSFDTEIQEFIKKKDGKEFEKLYIVKFINAIINSDLKIFEKLEKLNEEKFKVLIINLIDNFRKLDKFYDTETNNNPEFRKIYNDFKNNIFYYKIEKKWSENYLDEIPIFYWHETQIRREIYEHFENIFIFNSSDSENKFLSQQKSLRSE